jgi:ABC-type nitrate/sulfonate/bicarbonate transport system permease component
MLGVPLGLLMGLYGRVYANTRVVLEPFRFIPPIAWIPLAIIFFSGMTRFAFLIFLGAFFPVFTAALIGVRRVELIHRKVALVFGASKGWILAHIVVPTVLPDILGGMRVGLGAAWLTIVAAELAGGISLGLGRMMSNYAELVQVPQVIVGMILIGALGFLMNEVLLLAEKFLFRWRWQVTL